MGRIRYSQVEAGDIVMDPLRTLCKDNDLKVDFYTKSIGYELRCHPPVSFDIEYTRFLGYGAVKHLLDGRTGVMVTKNFDALSYETLAEMRQEDGTIRGRRVDLSSDLYQIARSFMIR
jgi:6-phosphofructokinase 1